MKSLFTRSESMYRHQVVSQHLQRVPQMTNLELRKVASHWALIHFFVFLGLFSLSGVVFADNNFLIVPTVLSFASAICGAFIKVIDTIKNT